MELQGKLQYIILCLVCHDTYVERIHKLFLFSYFTNMFTDHLVYKVEAQQSLNKDKVAISSQHLPMFPLSQYYPCADWMSTSLLNKCFAV